MATGIIIYDDGQRALAQQDETSVSPAAAYIASLISPHSRRNMLRYLNQIAAMLTNGQQDAASLNWSALSFEHTNAIRAKLAETYAPATVNVMLSALRGVLKTAWRLGQMSADDYTKASNIENVKGETLPAGRDLAADEILALAQVCADDDSAAGIRDAAIIAILNTCGLRRAELAALNLEDIDINKGKITIQRGKGRKGRTVYVRNGALDALKDWLSVRGTSDTALFCHITKKGKTLAHPGAKIHTHKALTAQAMYKMLATKRGVEAGVKDFSPHDFRRTFAGTAMSNGIDIATVAKLMGHANVETTRRYDRRGEEVKEAAADKMLFPYRRRTGA